MFNDSILNLQDGEWIMFNDSILDYLFSTKKSKFKKLILTN